MPGRSIQRKPFPAEQAMLPGMGREPAMENHHVPAIIPADQAGNWSISRHDAIVTRYKLTDAIKYWNGSVDSTGRWTHITAQEHRYGRLTRQLLDALELSDEQRRMVREKREYRDNVEACILMCFNLAEMVLAQVIRRAVDTREMRHQQIHGAFTEALKRLAPSLLTTIAQAKDILK